MKGSENFSVPYTQTFSKNNCFLCGKCILEEYSVEHIFPRWLQTEFDLWNYQVHLLNNSFIQYRYLTVPCCKSCNNEILSNIENALRNALSGGYEKFCKLEEPIIFHWIGKIFYSLLYKELSLLTDRSKPYLGTINTKKYLETFNGLHTLLQTARYPTKFKFHFPWSIFIFNLKPFGDERDFDYHDDADRGTVKIRMRDVGLIVCLLDNGSVKHKINNMFNCIEGQVIHPIQFEEISAIIFSQNIFLDRNPTFFNVIEDVNNAPEFTVCPLPIAGMSRKPVFRNWDTDVFLILYTKFLKKYGYSYNDLVKGDYFCSFTFNYDGTYIPMCQE